MTAGIETRGSFVDAPNDDATGEAWAARDMATLLKTGDDTMDSGLGRQPGRVPHFVIGWRDAIMLVGVTGDEIVHLALLDRHAAGRASAHQADHGTCKIGTGTDERFCFLFTVHPSKCWLLRAADLPALFGELDNVPAHAGTAVLRLATAHAVEHVAQVTFCG